MTVALPPGNWIHYWTGKPYTGTATVPVPIDQGPIFVKAGSIIPLGPVLTWVDEKPADPLTLDIYPADPAGLTSYNFYEDDGISQGYMGGAYSTTKLTADNTGGKMTVGIGPQTLAKYDYAGRLCSRTYVLKINLQAAAPTSVSRDGSALASVASSAALDGAATGWFYDAVAKIVWVKFPLDASAKTSVTVQ
jgi:hypothetical protein